MGDGVNMIKELDIQVVLRRLEARKKNITRDGKMSRKQLASAYRGYHGLESQYYAMTQRTNDAMFSTKAKNDHLNLKLEQDIKRIASQEKLLEIKSDRDIRGLREDFTAQLAYQYVYKNHSFRKYDRANSHKKIRPASDKPELYDAERKPVPPKTPRPLGSLRQMVNYENELKVKFPPIKDHDSTINDKEKITVNAMGDRTYEDIKELSRSNSRRGMKDSFPNIETAMGVEIRYRNKLKEDDKGSLYSAPAGVMEAAQSATGEDHGVHVAALDMGQNLMLMRQKAKEKLYERHRLLPAPPPSRTETRNESWRRILPPTPSRPSTVLPNKMRNSVEIKQMYHKEATEVMDKWANINKRKELVEKIKEMEKNKRYESSFPIFDRTRPTSAILKDFEQYKKYKEEVKANNEQNENDQPFIVRQMSPQPRIASPIAQKRSEYSRVSSPVMKREGSVVTAKESKLKRTDSEKIPSVSRTSSYKDCQDASVMHENALLTAAERIEMEKERRELQVDIDEYRMKMENNAEKKSDKPEKPRRKLPPTPFPEDQKSDKKRKERNKPVKMFDTSILRQDDAYMIRKVQQANSRYLTETSHTVATESQVPAENNETDPYTPLAKQIEKKHLTSKTLHGLDSERLEYITSATGKALFPKKVHQDYDHFSRTTPNRKKALELRAKNRRKIQMKNAQLADEKAVELKQKDSGSTTVGSERPNTCVSFNENVIVFQTI